MAVTYNTIIHTPKGKVVESSTGKIKIEHDPNYYNRFNNELNQVQMYLDKRCAEYLMKYVTFDRGVQQKSIPISSDYGSGYVLINVPYARYQAYSTKIRKRDPKDMNRGTRPWERMIADNKGKILNEINAYARRIHK